MKPCASPRPPRLPILLPLAYLLSCCALPLLSACTAQPNQPTAQSSDQPRFEVLTSDVPAHFWEAVRWNDSSICPEGSVLSPLTKFRFESGQDARGFKTYYGRSCEIVRADEPEGTERKLASMISSGKLSPSDSISTLPHGPFVWWYEDGKRMETGTFDHGTLATDLAHYAPDGSRTTIRD